MKKLNWESWEWGVAGAGEVMWTFENMTQILTGAGLEIVEQFQSWEDDKGTEFEAGLYQDAITVFVKK